MHKAEIKVGRAVLLTGASVKNPLLNSLTLDRIQFHVVAGLRSRFPYWLLLVEVVTFPALWSPVSSKSAVVGQVPLMIESF